MTTDDLDDADHQDWQFFAGYVMSTVPPVTLAPLMTPTSWAALVAAVGVAVAGHQLVAREVRIRGRLAAIGQDSAQVTTTEDSAADSSGQRERTAV